MTVEKDSLRLVVQKSGRLTEKSLSLLERSGLVFDWSKDKLFSRCENFPCDLMLVRDDDIPEYVFDGVCELGIVGLNVLQEKMLAQQPKDKSSITILRKLGFGQCRLSIAVPKEFSYDGVQSLAGKRIATSYPQTLSEFLGRNRVEAKVVQISGSVEIAPTLRIADAICDLVSTGKTLISNGLREVEEVLQSQSVLVKTPEPLSKAQERTLDRLLQRIDGVRKAANSKYIMMNAPRAAVESIKDILPGMENPSILSLGGHEDKVAIHAVASENIFWETMERLKAVGASSILVVPIEKIID